MIFTDCHCRLSLQEITGIEVPTNALYDIQIKRIHEYKRQHLNMFSVINRYLDIKKMSKEEKNKVSHNMIYQPSGSVNMLPKCSGSKLLPLCGLLYSNCPSGLDLFSIG